MSSKFIQVDRGTLYLLPPSVDEWLPEDHLARFIVEIVSQLDLKKLKEEYAGCGSKAYDPEMLLALLFFGYATGVFSSRKIERSTYDSVAFRYIAANTYPDHDTIANFRKRFLNEIKQLFIQILMIAKEMGLLKIGKVSLDGTKVKANASKHRALSWGYACKLEKQLKGEVEELMRLAEEADNSDIPDGMNIPEEISIRKDRLSAITTAKKEIEKRSAERYEKEKEEYDKRIAERDKKEKETGKKVRSKKPEPPEPGPRKKDQVNLTDAESRIMPVSSGYEQTYNAQACVDIETNIIVENHVSQCPNDKQEITPALKKLEVLREEIGKVEAVLADSGYFSSDNVDSCEKQKIVPYIASGREKHNQHFRERFSEPLPLEADADPVTKMKHRLSTQEGRKIYGKRKNTIEPAFGIIKHVMGFRQFLLRGKEAVTGEWNLVSIAYNLKKLHVMTRDKIEKQRNILETFRINKCNQLIST